MKILKNNPALARLSFVVGRIYATMREPLLVRQLMEVKEVCDGRACKHLGGNLSCKCPLETTDQRMQFCKGIVIYRYITGDREGPYHKCWLQIESKKIVRPATSEELERGRYLLQDIDPTT